MKYFVIAPLFLFLFLNTILAWNADYGSNDDSCTEIEKEDDCNNHGSCQWCWEAHSQRTNGFCFDYDNDEN